MPLRRVAFLLVSACMLLYGARQTIAELFLVNTNGTIAKIREQEKIPPEDLTSLIAAEELSLSTHPNAMNFSNLGIAEAMLAVAHGSQPAQLDSSRAALKNSLALAPSNPYVWLRMAVIDLVQGKPAEVTADHWRMAYLTGPNEETLHIPRFRVAMQIWQQLSPDDHENVFSDIRAAWRQSRDNLVAEARDPFAANVIRAGLAVDVRDLIAFEGLARKKR